MYLVKPLSYREATGKVKMMLEAVENEMGLVPNFFNTIANSPAAMEVYLSTSETLHGGVLPRKTQEKIAIAIASHNNCDYCLAAHTAIGRSLGIPDDELRSAQSGLSMDFKERAILEIAIELNAHHGHPGGEVLQKARTFGITVDELFEIAANVTLNILSNTVNGMAYTELDFPHIFNTEVDAA